MHNARAGVFFKPHARVTVEADYHSFWLAHRRDGLYDAGGNLVRVAERGRPSEPTVTLDLASGAETVGSLRLAARSGERDFRRDEDRLLRDLARQAGAAVHALRLRDDLIRSRERLVLAREEERRRLRQDLHDGLGPSLAAIGVRAEAAGDTLTRDPDGARRLLAELGGDVQATLAEVRRLVDGLRPPALDELGLDGAIRVQAARLDAGGGGTGMAIRVSGPPRWATFSATCSPSQNCCAASRLPRSIQTMPL